LLPQTYQIEPQMLWRMLDVTRQLGAPIPLDAMLQQVIEVARQVLHADRGTVFLYDQKTDELYLKVATGLQEVRFPAKLGIAGQSAKTRQPINVPDCYADARFNQEIDRKTGYRTRCLLTVPLIGYDDSLVGVLQMLNKSEGIFDEVDERIAGALAAQCAVALQRAKLLEEQLIKQKLEADLNLARDIQQRILPKQLPKVAGYDLAGWNRAAEQTGGDIFDAIAVDDRRVLLMLADATGHGIGPALSVSQARSMVRMALRLGADLDALVSQLNDQLTDDLADNRFITAFLGRLDASAHQIKYHAGGQGPLLHFHAATGVTDKLEASAPPLGIMSGLPFEAPAPLDMQSGDILALISDGIFEYMDKNNQQFGEQRVEEVLRKHHCQPMAQLIQTIVQAVEAFADGAPQNDDMTMVLVRRLD
jgi:phosphoserine phosphatase